MVVTTVIVLINLVGAAAVLGIANFVLPLPAVRSPSHVRLVDALLAAGYVPVAVAVGVIAGVWRMLVRTTPGRRSPPRSRSPRPSNHPTACSRSGSG